MIMQDLLKRTVFILLITCLFSTASACTAFFIHQNGGMFLCKNFDWTDGEGLVMFSPSGKQYHDPVTGTSWTARYSSITFCYKETSNTVGGMNSEGLVIEELSALPYSFQEKGDKVQVNEFQWISYHLDNCASVEEVVRNQQNINLVPEEHCLHYIIADGQGDVAVIEFASGGCIVYRGDELPYPLLSNNPYASSLRYLASFNGFGGSMPVPVSKGSCDRFVIAAKQLQNISNNSNVCVNSCFCMLDKVQQYDTQWQIVYNIRERQIYFRVSDSFFLHRINLGAFMVNPGTEGFSISLMEFTGSARLDDLVTKQKPL